MYSFYAMYLPTHLLHHMGLISIYIATTYSYPNIPPILLLSICTIDTSFVIEVSSFKSLQSSMVVRILYVTMLYIDAVIA